MKIAKRDVNQRMARFEKVCRASGAKLTHQRMEIYREVAQTGDHPDVEKVFQGVRKRMPTVSKDTVYRTLWWLKELGLITTLGPPRERSRFDANLSHHHHFVCTQCGLTLDFYSDQFDKLKLPESVQSFGYVERTQIEVKGVCLRCAAKEKPSNQK
ncbi:Fur family transcriptional regulator [Desulfosarcina sp.]|uniref:Fur family transcriptional regulator n=1 Tax=Desulfosarcina sp. TaxID=2027861 RepID=UPI0029AD7F2D|nr:Fur family transcriptional regulator [Desulfosarcina sp.]MDX2455205.1 Fur family transcriptional regulator [Desulfosarcina sp.]